MFRIRYARQMISTMKHVLFCKQKELSGPEDVAKPPFDVAARDGRWSHSVRLSETIFCQRCGLHRNTLTKSTRVWCLARQRFLLRLCR